MKKVTFRRTMGAPRSKELEKQLRALEELRDDEIDTSDIPSTKPSDWQSAVRGKFYKPLKKAVSLRLDIDILDWLKQNGSGYQTRTNAMLRRVMEEEQNLRIDRSNSVDLDANAETDDVGTSAFNLEVQQLFREGDPIIHNSQLFSAELMRGNVFA